MRVTSCFRTDTPYARVRRVTLDSPNQTAELAELISLNQTPSANSIIIMNSRLFLVLRALPRACRVPTAVPITKLFAGGGNVDDRWILFTKRLRAKT